MVKGDLINRLRANADYMANCETPLPSEMPDLARDFHEAAIVLERLRKAFLKECEEMGYEREAAEEMLALVEAGEATDD